MALTQISTAGVKDDAVTAGKIPANAVGSSEIAANAVGSSELADNAVDEAAIATGAVTVDKIGSGQVTETKIATGAVTVDKIGNNQVNMNKLSDLDNGRIIARVSSGAGNPEAATAAQVRTLLNVADGATQTTINNNAGDRVITGSGTANTLNGESGLTYDGSTTVKISGSGQQQLVLGSTNAGSVALVFDGDSNGDAAGGDYSFIRHNTDGDLDFFARSTGGATNTIFKQGTTEKLRIQSGGGISFNGDTAAANALDDYEEGTWDCSFQTNSGSFPSQSAVGRYTKIGRTVHVQGQVFWGASNGSGSGIIWMTLPFQNTSAARGGFAPGLVSGLDFDSEHQLYVMPEINSYNMYWMQSKPNDPAGGHAHLTPSAFRNYASRAISFAGTYMV